MSTSELNLFSYEILGLVGQTGAGAHDLLQMARQSRMLDWAGESQYYVEPKRLARLGYVDARREPGRTRERTVYSLTKKGLRALEEYARTPVEFSPLKSDALLRLLVCDLVGEAPTRESLKTLRVDLADIAVRLVEGEARAASLPHREKYLLIVIGFMRRVLEVHEELIETVERELNAAPGEQPRARARPSRVRAVTARRR
jgi:DNA-binding PadR family transcriptional regulator